MNQELEMPDVRFVEWVVDYSVCHNSLGQLFTVPKAWMNKGLSSLIQDTKVDPVFGEFYLVKMIIEDQLGGFWIHSSHMKIVSSSVENAWNNTVAQMPFTTTFPEPTRWLSPLKLFVTKLIFAF